MERAYRRLMRPSGLTCFRVAVGETDLWVAAERDLTAAVKERAAFYRRQIKAYMRRDKDFAGALAPLQALPGAPAIVRRMLAAGKTACVGPMAAVAGAVAQTIGEDLAVESPEILIENGGDLFVRSAVRRVVAVWAGTSPLTGRIGILLPPCPEGMGVCTSAGTVGPSLSFGRADAAVIVTPDAALADAAATALGNRVKTSAGLEEAVNWAVSLPGVVGALAIIGERLAAAGGLELVSLNEEWMGGLPCAKV